MARRFVLKSDPPAPAPALSIDYAGALNAQQYAAATAGGGPLLVIAGAGTGKTRTLIYRVAYLVETNVPPEQIVLLTFTRRAAHEMVNRAAGLLDGRCKQVRGGTFHAFCLRLLKRYGTRIGLPSAFTLLDASDAADVLNVMRTRAGYHKSEKRFPKKTTLRNLFSAVGNRGLPLREILETEYPQFVGHLDALTELQADYRTFKRTHGLLDYDDLLMRTLELFDAHPDAQKQVAAGCKHVLVDEYQDTNRLQADLVSRFASVHGNVMVVGDDAQSIYRFRGADFKNIFTFADDFPGTRLLKLEHNYRSTQPILDFANHILQRARRKYDKHLFTDTLEGEAPALVPAPDEHTESRFICQTILQLREEGLPLNRVAVLFRSSYNSFDLELELNHRQIPFVKYGGLKLSEAAHVKDVIAHMKVLENPRDAIAWNRILLLLEGIGPKTAQDITAWIVDTPNPFTAERPFQANRYVQRLDRLFDLLRGLHTTSFSLPEELAAILHYYLPMIERLYPDDAAKRTQDLEHFAGLAENSRDRAHFLSTLALDPIDMTATDTEAAQDDEPPLILSTIHSAKGLEFHTVFLMQALDGVLPSAYAINDPDALDEELRLLYVAVTRAEQDLFVSYPILQHRRSYTSDYFSNPSRFLKNVPEALLEPCQLVEEDAPPQLPSPA